MSAQYARSLSRASGVFPRIYDCGQYKYRWKRTNKEA